MKTLHGENCNCENCVKKRIASNHGSLTCACAHCVEQESVINNIDNDKNIKKFFILYGISIIRIIISICFLVLGTTLRVDDNIKFVLKIISFVVGGYYILIDCIKGFIKKDFLNENGLMLIASIVAFIMGEYLEAVLIVNLFSLGNLFESLATNGTKKRIAGLSKLKTNVARLVDSAGINEIECEKVEIGSLIEVRKGDRVPIDGVILGSSSYFDMKSITGESKNYHLKNGDSVYSGAINLGDAVIIKTTKLFCDSTAEKIIALVEQSTARKAKSQKFISKFAKYYTPSIVIVAVLIAVIPPLFNYEWSVWIHKALSFLVVSCPCALVISVPLCYFIGIGSLAKKGILVKGGNYIDVLSNVKTFVSDKTGTITKGNFRVQSIQTYNGFSQNEVLNYASCLEQSSSHPIALAILEKFKSTLNVEQLNEVVGKGVKGIINGKNAIIGSYSFMIENGISVQFVKEAVYVAVEDNVAGAIIIADEIKENAKITLIKLKKLGVNKTIMLSGDNERNCELVAKSVGFDKFYSNLLPTEKNKKLEKIIKICNRQVAFVGDGINDAPSISMSDVGISMGGLGSQVAIETSDVVILDDDLSKIPYAIKSSKRIRGKAIQNIVFSLLVKFLIVIFGVIFNLPIWLSMAGDVGAMLLAVFNSITNYIPIKE